MAYLSVSAQELNNLDGITDGTVAASKAVVVDANKDIGTFRNVTINGTLSDGNYTFDTSGNVSGLGTVGSGAITSSGVVTATGFTIGSAVISETELEILDGATLSTTELNYVDGVTSAIQTQLGTKTSITSATFTPSGWGGFSSDPTGDMRYQIIGDGTHKYVFITDDSGAAMVGTSNATGFTWGGIPAAARPDTPVSSMSFPSTNAGYVGQMNAIAQIATDGTVTMAAQPLSGSPEGPWWLNAGWTNSGDKGFPAGYVIMYPLVITS